MVSSRRRLSSIGAARVLHRERLERPGSPTEARERRGDPHVARGHHVLELHARGQRSGHAPRHPADTIEHLRDTRIRIRNAALIHRPPKSGLAKQRPCQRTASASDGAPSRKTAVRQRATSRLRTLPGDSCAKCSQMSCKSCGLDRFTYAAQNVGGTADEGSPSVLTGSRAGEPLILRVGPASSARSRCASSLPSRARRGACAPRRAGLRRTAGV